LSASEIRLKILIFLQNLLGKHLVKDNKTIFTLPSYSPHKHKNPILYDIGSANDKFKGKRYDWCLLSF
jgi:hypothetical protein